MPLFRCKGCKAEFEAAKPVCVSCNFDPAADPRAAQMFDELQLIHLDPPSAIPGCGKGYAACDPKLKYVGKRRFTSSPRGVTCPLCKASAAFAEADPDGNGVREGMRVGPLAED